MEDQNLQNNNENSNLKGLLSPYFKNWKWFIVSIILFFAFSTVYLRYAVPKYAAQAKIRIVDDQGTGIDLFKELDIISGGKNNVTDEIELINSYSNYITIVKQLGLNIKITQLGKIKNRELYGNTPVQINIISPDSLISKADLDFYLEFTSSAQFRYSEEEDGPIKIYAFGDIIPSAIGDIVITPNLEIIKRFQNEIFKISIRPISTVAQAYKGKVEISATDNLSNIVNLYLEDPVEAKAKDILNSLISSYNIVAIEDKKIIADRTSEFINDRISDISLSLSSVDQSAQELKTSKGLTDMASEANINLNFGAANRQELANFNTQLNIASSMKDIVDQQQSFEVLPGNLGLNDPSITSTTERYNQLVLERQRLLKSSTEKSPIIQNLDQRLAGLKQSLRSSLNSTVNNLGVQVNTLSNQQAIINSKIYSAPGNERQLRDITRQQQTTESLYLFLLQKREEAQLVVASASPKSKIIDYAYSPSIFPVSPKINLIYMVSFLLGLLVPFSIIYVHDLFDNKLYNMHSLEKLARNIPILGELPKLSKKDIKMVVKDDRSILSESLRIIRTNLDYLLKSESYNKNKNVVFITSSTPGEGKTFLATNLAMILASTRKKVLLIGGDIRNPKFYTFFTGKLVDKIGRHKDERDLGLTDFIFDPKIQSSEIINSLLVHSNELDVIYSGKIPPNPAELLTSDRISALLREMSESYDYVIVDTAPLMVVTDTLLISKYSDLVIYVTRAGVTEKNVISFPIKLKNEGKIPNLCFVVNDVKSSNLGYGGKYGYGYGEKLKKWWQFNT